MAYCPNPTAILFLLSTISACSARSVDRTVDFTLKLVASHHVEGYFSRVKRSDDAILVKKTARAGMMLAIQPLPNSEYIQIRPSHMRKKREVISRRLDKAVKGLCQLDNGDHIPLGEQFATFRDGRSLICDCPTPDSGVGEKAAVNIGHAITTTTTCRGPRYKCQANSGELAYEGERFNTTLHGHQFECLCPIGLNPTEDNAELKAECLPSSLTNHIFCQTDSGATIAAGKFFEKKSHTGENLHCVCPVLSEDPDVVCIKEDTSKSVSPHECLTPTGEIIHPGKEVHFSIHERNVTCHCPSKSDDKSEVYIECKTDMDAYKGFHCQLTDGRSFKSGEEFFAVKDKRKIRCVCPEFVPSVFLPNGIDHQGTLLKIRCKFADA